ncbi:MFS transporter [Microlunatus flavus]|uniref:Predicted arabinose efflux permease, MFS family n=1 Tax=Microlunatus flavus TaxID=1036181 RepID=A0A1H9M1I0_9ACTN|nr:MFS transporter [Microlunatus flavus]SER17337.1 Predicted arabinose efflux permease, MFS family [Microlunatus flavus]
MSAPAPDRQPWAGRGFGLLWFGEGVSLLGGATAGVLLPLLAVVAFHAGPVWMGLLSAAAWLPWLVVGLPAGAWVDRLPPRAVMIVADLVAALVVGSVPVAWWFSALTLPHLLVVALLNGTCAVFFRTAYVALLPRVVPDHDLERANGRLAGTESCAGIVGPGLAGLLAQVVSAASGLVVDALSYLVSALCLWRVRPVTPSRPARTTEPLRSQVRTGLRIVLRDPYLRWLSGLGGLSNLGLTGYQALLVLYLVRELQVPGSAVGVVLTLGATGGVLGAVLGAPVARRWGSGRASTWLLVLSGPPALLLPLASPGRGVVLVVVATFLAGALVVAGNVVRAAWRQRYVRPEVLGRVVTTMQLVNYGTMPVGGVLAGGLATALGTRTAIGLLAGVHLVACLGMLLSRFRSLRELPRRSTPTAVGHG